MMEHHSSEPCDSTGVAVEAHEATKVRALAWHLLTAAAIAVLAYLLYYSHYPEFASSDGSNYCNIARNLAEGRGLTASVICPGLIKAVPTSRSGQGFFTQQPLWPLMLAGWFKLFGPTTGAATALAILLAVFAAMQCWLLGYLFSGRVVGGYLALTMLLMNPLYASTVFALYNTPLQSALIGALFILMFGPPRARNVILASCLLGMGLVTRETSLFVGAGLLWAWLTRPGVISQLKYHKPSPGKLLRWMLVATLSAILLFGPQAVESRRRAQLLAGQRVSTLRSTFLYLTPVFDMGWVFIYDYVGLRIDPVVYFTQNPFELVRKISYSLFVLCLRDTLPALLAYAAWYVPVAAPWLLGASAARRVGIALFVAAGVQVLASSLTYMHAHYFLAFLPVIYGLVAATCLVLLDRVRSAGLASWKNRAAACLLVYAIWPVLISAVFVLGGRPLPTGENGISHSQVERISNFVREHTAPDAVIVAAPFTGLLSWHTRRTMIIYSGHPDYRISDSSMWRKISQEVPIDNILLTSLSGATEKTEVLGGFLLKKKLSDDDLKVWLYERSRTAGESPPEQSTR